MISIARSAFAVAVLPVALAAQQQQQRLAQPVTISIMDAFNEQLHPPLPLTHAPQPTTAAITAADLMTRLYIYAADSMMGRETGTKGHVMATNYIEHELRAMGLKPGGDNGTFFQNLPVVLRSLDPKSTIVANGKTFTAGKDFVATAGRGGGPMPKFPSGAVIYNGRTGDTAGALTAQQVKGKIVLNRAAPGGFGGGRGFGGGGGRGAGGRGAGGFGAPNPLDSALAVVTVVDSLTTAQVNAALNPSEKNTVFLLNDPKYAPYAPGRSTAGRPPLPPGGANISLQLPAAGAAPALTITRAVAEALLGGLIDDQKRGAIGKTMTTNVNFIEKPKPARNVVAILPGSDPKLKNEYVAIGAHSDHVGIAAQPVDHDSVRLYNSQMRTQGLENRQPAPVSESDAALLRTLLDSLHKVNGVRMDSINNGADDDGSGSVTLLEIAEAFAKLPAKPKRSIVFVWHVAEEKGLWGSDWFTRYPTVPRDSIVAQLNMDMVGRGKAEDIPGGGLDYIEPVGWDRLSSELGKLARDVTAKEKTPFKFDLMYDAPNQPNNIYCRSDHANYARFGIPIVYYTTGLHRDYHQVTDEPQYMDYPHMANVGQFMYDMGMAVANMDHKPVVDGNRPKDPLQRCVNNGVVPDSLAIRGSR